jgi:hypothetical protein
MSSDSSSQSSADSLACSEPYDDLTAATKEESSLSAR